MLENETFAQESWIFVGIIVIIILIALLARLFIFFEGFMEEMEFLNSKIYSTTGEERQYWIHEKRKLWLSLIPFVKY